MIVPIDEANYSLKSSIGHEMPAQMALLAISDTLKQMPHSIAFPVPLALVDAAAAAAATAAAVDVDGSAVENVAAVVVADAAADVRLVVEVVER